MSGNKVNKILPKHTFKHIIEFIVIPLLPVVTCQWGHGNLLMSLQSLQSKPFHFNVPLLNKSAVSIQMIDINGSKSQNYTDWTKIWFRLAE